MSSYKTMKTYNSGNVSVPVVAPVMLFDNTRVYNQLVPSYGSSGYDINKGNSYNGYYGFCTAYSSNPYGCDQFCGINDPTDPCYTKKRSMTNDSKSNADKLVMLLNRSAFYRAQAIRLTDLVNDVLYTPTLPPFSDSDVMKFVDEMLASVSNVPRDPNDKTLFKITWDNAMGEFVEVPVL